MVRWEKICQSRDSGGLGVLNLRKMNQALLGKWLWKYFNEPKLSWRTLIHFIIIRIIPFCIFAFWVHILPHWNLNSQIGSRVQKWETKTQFRVRSYYHFLHFGGISFALSKIRSIAMPLKVRIPMWQVIKEKLNT